MKLDTDRIRRLLKSFDFETLFIEELGWDNLFIRPQVVTVGEAAYTLTSVAQKKGVQIFRCDPDADGHMPDYPTRQKIDRQVTKWAREHLIIFVDKDQTTQIWQWVKRQQGKPTAYREHTYHTHQSGEALIQKLRSIAFTLDEEEFLLLSDVTYRLEDALDKDTVTKKFYKEFEKHRKGFLNAIQGIDLKDDREWYTSVMLNRLMFVYFIQKKGFLDGDPDYLRNRLKQCREQFGRDKFYSFYRTFLLRLFHDGFARKETERDEKVHRLLGDIPYLNGGIFQPHSLEQAYSGIDIPDGAFERIFNFFDRYQWHLDYRPLRDDREINPDVLGYIFEQYINNKQMGAYYTKEDITGYISRNTVLPFLFDEARKGCKEAFEGEQSIWKLLQEDPDRYIYPAVKHGIYDEDGNRRELPPKIADGLDTSRPNLIERRKAWNTLAPPEYALPTEIWREVVARRRRYDEVRGKLERGEVRDVNDLITLNLDIEQFAQDVIERCEGPYLLRAFFKALQKVAILDPTCGSGAFLFAALEILEPLYLACLTRMQAFVEDLERSGEKHHPKKYEDFRRILAEALDERKHPNLDYYVYKSIILNNLYGVDIMEEAVEICKLRLFLKLAAQVERKEDLEPLPDIDFNIRAGNTLVGYATLEEAQKAVQSKLDFDDAWTRIEEKAMDVAILAERFREQQTTYGGVVTPEDKQALREKLAALADELNGYLAAEYGVKKADAEKYQAWLASHRSFHWFVEFYGIMSNGGFDVVIGNPPYKELRQVRNYSLHGYNCLNAGNLYAVVLERCSALSEHHGRQGYIVPVSSISTDRYASLQRHLMSRPLIYSSYDDRPSRLFDGLEHIRLTIHLIGPEGNTDLVSSRYNKWYSEERETLFQILSFMEAEAGLVPNALPKLSSHLERSILDKLSAEGSTLATYTSKHGRYPVYYSRKVGYFLQVLNFEPLVLDRNGERRPPSEFKTLLFDSQAVAHAALCCLNSNLMFWFVHVFSDCRHLNKREVNSFPINLMKLANGVTGLSLVQLAQKLMTDLDANSERRIMRFNHDTLTVQCIMPRYSKHVIDEIDRVLAKHYRFTEEELDFIINYDIKYRMGLSNLQGEGVVAEEEAEV